MSTVPPPGQIVPARRASSTGGSRTRNRSPRFELGRFAGLRTVPSVRSLLSKRATSSALDGSRTRGLDRDRVASTPPAPRGQNTPSRDAAAKAPGAGIEPTSPGSEPGVAASQLPRNSYESPCRGSGRRTRTFIVSFKGCRPTVSRSPSRQSSRTLVQSALGESNPRGRRGKPMPGRSAKGTQSETTTRQRKERESNPQGLAPRPVSSGVPSPVGWPFRVSVSSRGGSRTHNRAVNSRSLYR